MNLAVMSYMFSMMTAGVQSVSASIFAIFREIGDWIIETIPNFFVLFYNPETGLTIIGVLTVCSLGIGVCFLLVGFIRKFFKFR